MDALIRIKIVLRTALVGKYPYNFSFCAFYVNSTINYVLTAGG